MLTLPAGEDDRQDLYGQRDDDTDLASPQLMSLESLGRIATETPFTITHVLNNRRLVLLDGDQDWRRSGGQDDEEIGFFERGTCLLSRQSTFLFFLCAHRPKRGGLLEKMPDGGLMAGWGRALLSQILRD